MHNIEKQFEMLRTILIVYTPVIMHILLKMDLLHRQGRTWGPGNSEYENTKKIIGFPISRWPEDIQVDFEKMGQALPWDRWMALNAEITYFLIFIILGNTAKHLDEKDNSLLSSFLFEIFNNRQLWSEDYPANDAISKYFLSNNFLVEFQKSLSPIIKNENSLFWFDFSGGEVSAISKFFIQPAIEKVFQDFPTT